MKSRNAIWTMLTALVLLVAGVGDANARGWGYYGVPADCYGCYGYYGWHSGYVGPIRRIVWRAQARRAACCCYGGYMGCYGCCYTSCWSSCCYEVSDCTGCSGSPVIYESTPTESGGKNAQPEPVPAEPMPAEGASLPPGAAVLAVDVPAGATVFVNGNKTDSEGSYRRYMSTGLKSGHKYRYEVRAVVDHRGKVQTLTKSVTLTEGAEANLSFDFPEIERPETVLTLYVPDEAQVQLSGSSTNKTGPKRVFTTAELKPGQVWEEYRVRVTVNRSGQEIVREQTVALCGGESHELRFDFNDALLVSH